MYAPATSLGRSRSNVRVTWLTPLTVVIDDSAVTTALPRITPSVARSKATLDETGNGRPCPRAVIPAAVMTAVRADGTLCTEPHTQVWGEKPSSRVLMERDRRTVLFGPGCVSVVPSARVLMRRSVPGFGMTYIRSRTDEEEGPIK